jgi:hypothetical protein
VHSCACACRRKVRGTNCYIKKCTHITKMEIARFFFVKMKLFRVMRTIWRAHKFFILQQKTKNKKQKTKKQNAKNKKQKNKKTQKQKNKKTKKKKKTKKHKNKKKGISGKHTLHKIQRANTPQLENFHHVIKFVSYRKCANYNFESVLVI